MDRHDVRASLDEGLEIGIGRRDHQVHVEGQRAVPAQRAHQRGAEGDVRHEMPVHDVEMQPVGAGGFDGVNLLAQSGEVSGQEGWGDAD